MPSSIHKAQSSVRNTAQHIERVAVMQPDIGDPPIMNMLKRHGNAVEIWFATDETVIGQHIGARNNMLPAAKADLKMQRLRCAKERRCVDDALIRNADLRQQVFDQPGLLIAQLLALGPAI